MRILWTAAALVVVLAAGGWFGWHYLQYRSCGERTCPPTTERAPLELDSGGTVSLLSTRVDERGRVVIDYLTDHDRTDRAALCEEARAVWEAAREELDTRRLDHAVLGPTSPKSEFLGLSYGVLPLYTCCVTTPLGADKTRDGTWTLPECTR